MIASWLGINQDGRRKRKHNRRPEFESRTEPANSFNHTDDFRYNVSSSGIIDFVALNDTKSRDTTSGSKNASSRRMTSSNGRYVQQQMILDSPYRYRHHAHAQHPIEQHPQPSKAASSMSISYRMQSAAGVGVIAGVFFCLTLFATLALGVFCRKRNSVFANSSEQVDYSSTAPNDDEEADWLASFNDDTCDCNEATGSERRLSGELVMVEDDVSSDCDTSPSHDGCGEGRTRLVETRFERRVERSKGVEKRERIKTSAKFSYASESDELRREHLHHHHHLHQVHDVRKLSSQRPVAKRPETLALPIVNPPKENGKDSDTTGLYFQSGSGCDVTDASQSPPAVDKLAELSTTSSLLSTVFRDSISVSALLTGEVNFDDVSVVSYQSQRPGCGHVGSSPDVLTAASQRQASEMLQQQLVSGHVFPVT